MVVANTSSSTQRIFCHSISLTKFDAKPLPLSFSIARGTTSSVCSFILTFVACTFIFVLNPATRSSSP
ncbi:hypothetical protein NL676_018756 [Syzygium grande]|nr:hypothetical protein NL676_018756 [Syzygium grande]